MNFERGFKTWAERTSANLRKELGLSGFDPLPPKLLADYLEVRLCTPRDVPNITQDVLDQLLEHDPWGWSAVSVFQPDRTVVIFNPRRSGGRRASDIMHELAHIILDHRPATIVMSHDGSFVMRSYDEKQEGEANWLGWCLLLPREALLRCLRRGLSEIEIADTYGVTETLANFRIRMTGVGSQLKAATRYRKPS
jgi:Zn-dependent peptidase ImmA (M78 family)